MTASSTPARPRVVVLSPHFDDVPLSLGQSLSDGVLSRCEVEVHVAFGRTNWSQWVHPTRSRARWIGLLRRSEEWRASRRFGYRWRAAEWEEALLRWDDLDPDRLLDHRADLSGDTLLVELTDWVRRRGEGVTPAGPPELLLAPAGLGGHVDHRLLALAAARARPSCAVPIGHYEDRPYASHLSEGRRADGLAEVLADPVPVDVSGPVTAATHRAVQRCYRSQMDDFFRSAMATDLRTGAVERVWFEAGEVPDRFA
jgi:LmbE family N-acetylglucosaminyl deacetylase